MNRNEDGTSFQPSTNLLDCLKAFTSTESLGEQVHCVTCQREQNRTKAFSIVKAPMLLMFHFKRFDFLNQKKVY